jgi:ELWxxDGT repeat protein
VSNGKPGKKNTHIVRDINPGKGDSFPYGFTVLPRGTEPDHIYFGAFAPDTFYQLYRTKEQSSDTTALIAQVAQTTSQSDNFATAPFYITRAGNDVAFAAENRSTEGGGPDLIPDVGFYNTELETATFLTDGDVDPRFLTYTGSGSEFIFSGFDLTSGRELWAGSGFSDTAELYDDINPLVGSSNPRPVSPDSNEFKFFVPALDAASNTYFVANGVDGAHLYRKFLSDGSQEITAVGTSLFNPTEMVAVGNTMYFVAQDSTGTSYLYKIADEVDETVAVRVTTGQGNPVKNPSHLGTAVENVGATALNRVYFACDGEGTEHAGRGSELWVFEE